MLMTILSWLAFIVFTVWVLVSLTMMMFIVFYLDQVVEGPFTKEGFKRQMAEYERSKNETT